MLCLLCGCHSVKNDARDLPPIPTHFIIPDTPPTFHLNKIQINSVPHPFNVGGFYAYAVWVNGKKASLNSHQINTLIKELQLKNVPPSSANIHNGDGWLHPLKLNAKQNSDNRINRQEETTSIGL